MIIKRHPDINCKVNPVWWPETLHPQPPPSLHFKIMRCKFFPNMHKFLGILSLAHHVRVRDVNIWRRWSQVLVDLWNFGEGDKESWECRRVGGELMAHVLNVITGPDGLKRTKMTAPPSPACKHLTEWRFHFTWMGYKCSFYPVLRANLRHRSRRWDPTDTVAQKLQELLRAVFESSCTGCS